MSANRRAELASNLDAVRDRIADAARRAGRDPADVTLIVVTKTFPVADVRLLADLGVRDVGENRHPEAGDKAAATADLALTWHFIGQLQSNKAGKVASYADVIHSVDSERLVTRLGAAATELGRTVTCLVQVNLDPPGLGRPRGGVSPDDARRLADRVADASGLRLGGLMAVAPPGEPAAPAFARLTALGADLHRAHPAASMLSAGMSGDFPAAISAGATHVRVGSAVLGSRPSLG